MEKTKVISELADIINEIRLTHPVRVGIDGVDCAGKTMLAEELVEPLRSRGREVIRASIDGFHNSSKIRYRQGRGSPKGYFEDSFNSDAVVNCLLSTLGPGGRGKYKTAQKANVILINNDIQNPKLIINEDDFKDENISYTCPS